MISLRLEKQLEDQLDIQSKLLGISKSELVRKCIQKFIGSKEKSTAWELGKDSFGKFSSGNGKLSQNKRKTVSEKIRMRKR